MHMPHVATHVNGVDVQTLQDAMEAMKKDPGAGILRHRAHNRWIDGGHCQTRMQEFSLGGQEMSRPVPFELHGDEPPALLGENHGPSATEAALHALAACLNTTFIYHAAARGVEVEDLRIELEAELDLRGLLGLSGEVRNGYSKIELTFHVKANAPEDTCRELCELAKKHSPVYDMLSHGVPIETKCQRG
jgi:uncharacterized OsmC-like protein